MGRATFLTRVVLENYKSIARCDVRLGPLMYLVGPNGSGKSNFLDAIAFVAEALRTSVGGALLIRHGGGAICHAANRAEGYFRIRLEFRVAGSVSGHYELKIGRPKENAGIAHWLVQDERLEIGGVELLGAGPRGDRLALALHADQPQYRSVYEALTGMRCYAIDPRSMVDVPNADLGTHYFADGSNLASVLYRVSRQQEDSYERIAEYLRLILPSLRRLHVEQFDLPKAPPSEATKVVLVFEQRIGGTDAQSFYPSQMSAGTLRALGVLTAVLGPTDSDRPTVIALEEPEAHVQPAVVGVLRDAMVEASYRNQIIVATQSADMLDDKEVSVDSILVFSADDGVTSIAGISELDRDAIRRKLYSPGELMRTGHLWPEPRIDGSENRLAPAGEAS